jgi:hypothetical protein
LSSPTKDDLPLAGLLASGIGGGTLEAAELLVYIVVEGGGDGGIGGSCRLVRVSIFRLWMSGGGWKGRELLRRQRGRGRGPTGSALPAHRKRSSLPEGVRTPDVERHVRPRGWGCGSGRGRSKSRVPEGGGWGCLVLGWALSVWEGWWFAPTRWSGGGGGGFGLGGGGGGSPGSCFM